LPSEGGKLTVVGAVVKEAPLVGWVMVEAQGEAGWEEVVMVVVHQVVVGA
jgi:hypothetical protein